MSGRRDDGYQVRYRLDTPRTRRANLAIVGTGLVVAVWLTATLTAPQIVRQDPTGSVQADRPEIPNTRPQVQPSFERFTALGDLSIPLLTYEGPSWLETGDGVLRTADDGCDAEWLFMWADGSTLCVSGKPRVRASDPAHRVMRTYSPFGVLTSTLELTEGPITPGERTVTDVALDSANGMLYIASARVGPDDHWGVWIDRWSIDDGTHHTARVAAGRDGVIPGTSVQVTLWLSPDARHARLRFAIGVGQFQPATEAIKAWTWNVPIDGPEPGEAVLVDEASFPAGSFCFAEGWATAQDFVAGCVVQRNGGANRVVVVRSSSIDGQVTDVNLGAAVPEELDWILSGTSGHLFLWAPRAHWLWRVDVPSLDVQSVGGLSPDDYLDVPADTPWPDRGDDRVAWEPRGLWRWPHAVERRPLVGAFDGRVVYAAGGTAESSSGIWAFDASSLTVLDRWDPVGAYTSLAMTPAGDHVIALGGPTPGEMAAFGNIGSTMAFHDARLGSVSLILRGDRSVMGLVVQEPYPKPT